MHVVVGGTRVGWPCCDALFCVGKVEIDRALGKKNVVQDAESPPLMMYIEKSFLGKKNSKKETVRVEKEKEFGVCARLQIGGRSPPDRERTVDKPWNSPPTTPHLFISNILEDLLHCFFGRWETR